MGIFFWPFLLSLQDILFLYAYIYQKYFVAKFFYFYYSGKAEDTRTEIMALILFKEKKNQEELIWHYCEKNTFWYTNSKIPK